MNVCMRRQILLWDVKRAGSECFTARISIGGFKKITTVAYKTKSRVKIIGRRGLPFYIQRYKKRKLLLFGLFFVILSVIAFSQFLWRIEVTGNVDISKQEIIDVINEIGVKQGVFRHSVKEQYIKNEIMTKIPELAGISLNLKGTVLYLDIMERNENPPLFDKENPNNLVAAESGVIEDITCYLGNNLVKEGDVVVKGQLLISGILQSRAVGLRYVNADAKIIARVWFERTEEVPRTEEIRTRTNKSKSKNFVRFGDFGIPIFFSDKVPFANFDRESRIQYFSLWKNFALPMRIHYDKYYEVTVENFELERQIAIDRTVQLLYNQMEEEHKEKNIISKEHEIITDEFGLTYVKATYETLIDIAEKQALDIGRER